MTRPPTIAFVWTESLAKRVEKALNEAATTRACGSCISPSPPPRPRRSGSGT
jgi:hypothetical protein